MKSLYGIFCRETDNCMYIGETSNYRLRCNTHRCTSVNSNYKNHDYQIYKWMRNNEYYFKELAIVEDYMAIETETKLMEIYHETILNLKKYNVYSIETRHRMRLKKLGTKQATETIRKKEVPVACYSLDNTFIKQYRSILSTKEDGYTPTHVGNCC